MNKLASSLMVGKCRFKTQSLILESDLKKKKKNCPTNSLGKALWEVRRKTTVSRWEI